MVVSPPFEMGYLFRLACQQVNNVYIGSRLPPVAEEQLGLICPDKSEVLAIGSPDRAIASSWFRDTSAQYLSIAIHIYHL